MGPVGPNRALQWRNLFTRNLHLLPNATAEPDGFAENSCEIKLGRQQERTCDRPVRGAYNDNKIPMIPAAGSIDMVKRPAESPKVKRF